MPRFDIAIEVDGPSHFSSSPEHLRLTGTTLAKHRVLRSECKHFFQVTGNLAQGEERIDQVMEAIQEIA